MCKFNFFVVIFVGDGKILLLIYIWGSIMILNIVCIVIKCDLNDLFNKKGVCYLMLWNNKYGFYFNNVFDLFCGSIYVGCLL